MYFTSYFRLFKYMVSFPRYFTVCITYQPPLVLLIKKYIIKIKVHSCYTFYKSCRIFRKWVCTSHIQFTRIYLLCRACKMCIFVMLKICFFVMLMVRIITTMLYGDKFNVDFVLWWLAWPFTFETLLVAFRTSHFSCWYCYCHILRAAGDITTLLVANPRVYFLNQCPRQYHYCGCISIWVRIYSYILYGYKFGEDQLDRSCEKWRSVTKSQGGEECRVNNKK